MSYFVYILHSPQFDRYYVGQTKEFKVRLDHHNKGFSKATSPFIPWEKRCVIEKESRSEALILERKLKNLNRKKLLDFIEKYG